MSADLTLFVVFIALVIILGAFIGKYMYLVFTDSPVGDKVFSPIENGIYRVCGVKDSINREMNWKEYTLAVIWFNVLGMLLLWLMQMVQYYLPFNPQKFAAPDWHLALNTAISFMTNTNWQGYGGETTLSYFVQMAGLTVQNFVSAATGIAVAIALIRGLVRHEVHDLGNFWKDLTRCVVRVLMPICVIGSLFLVSQGVIQNLSPYVTVTGLDGVEQTIAMGPVASQEIIKELGTNGGGFFNVNSAHPFENPTPFTNFIEMLAILVISSGLTFTFGFMAKSKKQGYAVLAAMTILFIIMLAVCYSSEQFGNTILADMGITQPTSFEGKEVRFGLGSSSLFTVVTTAASCGAVNNFHDSLTAIGGLVPMLQMMLGEIVFGGTGAGFYGMMIYIFLTVFIIGLMVGRTPEYLGKKIEANEMKMMVLALLIPACGILINSGISCVTEWGLAGLNNNGPHGLSEILYAYASTFGNNGSAFAGLTVNTLQYDLLLGLSMFVGRFAVIVPVMAAAGYMVQKKTVPAGPGTFDTTSTLFVIMLVCVVLIIGALTFFPALSLGPIVEQLLMLQGVTF